MINSQLGITYDNMPESLFSMMSNDLQACNDGGPKISINEGYRDRAVRLISDKVLELSGRQTNVVNIGPGTLQLNPSVIERRPIAPLQEHTPLQEHIPLQERPAALADEIEEADEAEDDDDQDHNVMERLVEGPRQTVALIPIETANVTQMLAAAMENVVSNNARGLADRVSAFQKMWTALLAESRLIQEATTAIESDPLIENIIGQVADIQNADNLIENSFFIEGFVVFITKELTTDNVINGHRRKVGRMEIRVNLKPLISSNNSRVGNPVIIRNLDRRFEDDEGSFFECGHVHPNGSICWGNAIGTLYQGFEQRDLHTVIDIIIRFIKQPNVADAYGKHMKHWPVAD